MPYSVQMDSGWNWTPQMGRDTWRNAITTPSAVQAIFFSSGGSGSPTISE